MARVPQVVFLLGGPGAGKSTLCAYLCEMDPSVQTIPLGKMLLNREDALDYIRAGRLVPSSIVLPLIKQNIDMTKSLVILDGFPRCMAYV